MTGAEVHQTHLSGLPDGNVSTDLFVFYTHAFVSVKSFPQKSIRAAYAEAKYLFDF